MTKGESEEKQGRHVEHYSPGGAFFPVGQCRGDKAPHFPHDKGKRHDDARHERHPQVRIELPGELAVLHIELHRMHAQVGRDTQPGIERIREPAKETVRRKIGMARTEDHPVVNQMIAEKSHHSRYQHVECHPEQMFAQDEQMPQEGRLLGSISRCILFAHRPRYAIIIFRSVVRPNIDSVFLSLAPLFASLLPPFSASPPPFFVRPPLLSLVLSIFSGSNATHPPGFQPPPEIPVRTVTRSPRAPDRAGGSLPRSSPGHR